MDNSKIKIGALILGALAAPVTALAYLYRRPLPKVNGTRKVSGLHAPVEIIRDHWGVPHIYAQHEDDLLFAQGYVHAQDRLWQMELQRRIGQGRLSEIFGELTFSADSLLRIIGLGRAARNDIAHASSETLHALKAYALGVNTFIGANQNKLPLEFTLLRFKPEAWQPVDSLAWAKMMSWGLSFNWDAEIVRAELISKLGAERAARLQGDYTADNPIIIPEHTFVEVMDRVAEHYREAEKWLPLQAVSGMSNNWVVDGNKSVTGKPLLANDPHLGLSMPAIWYENHLVSPEMESIGVSLPGTPGVVLGHNAELAWGATAAFADTQDLYLEKFHPDDPTLYEYQGAWEKANIVREEIRVKGESTPRTVDVTITRHGPIKNHGASPTLALPRSRGEGIREGARLALRWVGYEPHDLCHAVLGINRARNWHEFTEALRHWTEPSLNFVYADRAGNIGYYMAGQIPIRAKGIGQTPAPGWTGEYEWTGWIPHEELPQSYNPAQHYFATANNQVVGQEYPHFLTHETMNGFRARRIVELLTQKERLSREDFARIQVDQYCAPAKTLCGLLNKLGAEILNQPVFDGNRDRAEQALNFVRQWDCNLTADSVAGAIYEVTQNFAMRRVFEPWLGELTDHYIGVGFHPLLSPMIGTFHDRAYVILQRILTNNESEWFKPLAALEADVEGKPVTREEILARALNDALDFLQKTLGDKVAQWQWGKLHQAHFNHPLGAQKPLDQIFNRGPFPYGGDTSTVWQGAFIPKFPISPDATGTASWRQIMDPNDWDASLGIHTTGQSGHPASKHYDDMIQKWLKGEFHPLLWSREQVEANAEARLKLEP